MMDQKPLHYDGSVQKNAAQDGEMTDKEPFKITDEMRSAISANPFEDNSKE